SRGASPSPFRRKAGSSAGRTIAGFVRDVWRNVPPDRSIVRTTDGSKASVFTETDSGFAGSMSRRPPQPRRMPTTWLPSALVRFGFFVTQTAQDLVPAVFDRGLVLGRLGLDGCLFRRRAPDPHVVVGGRRPLGHDPFIGRSAGCLEQHRARSRLRQGVTMAT